METSQKTLTIKDLEALTGIKAHTIRIWEKRYNILNPSRSKTNIRLYDYDDLNRILNISYLYNHGYKISNISKKSHKQIAFLIHQLISENSFSNKIVDDLKMCIMKFDYNQFSKIYNSLLSKHSLKFIYCEIIFPLFSELNLLKQSEIISNSHCQFANQTIRQKLYVLIEKAQRHLPQKKSGYVLFSPAVNLSEMELLYIHLDILQQGNSSIYLGNNILPKDLKNIIESNMNLTCLMYADETSDKNSINLYISNSDIINTNKFWIYSNRKDIKDLCLQSSVEVFDSIEAILNAVEYHNNPAQHE